MAGNTIIASSERLHVAVPSHGKSIYLRVGSPLITNGAEIGLDEARAAFEALAEAISTADAILSDLLPVLGSEEEPTNV